MDQAVVAFAAAGADSFRCHRSVSRTLEPGLATAATDADTRMDDTIWQEIGPSQAPSTRDAAAVAVGVVWIFNSSSILVPASPECSTEQHQGGLLG
jgi:hypothetical protein